MTIKYLKNKFKYAFKGIAIAFHTDNSFKIHFAAAFIVLTGAYLLNFSLLEWILCLFAVAFVITAEMFNTAIEYLVRLFTDEYHEIAEKLLDISAGAVLLATLTSVAAGILILLQRVL